MALVTGQRVQTLSILDLKFVSFLNDQVFFHLSDHVKHSRRGKIVPPVKLSPYTDNKKLCYQLFITLPSYYYEVS